MTLQTFSSNNHDKYKYDLVVHGHTLYDFTLNCTNSDEILTSLDVIPGSFKLINETQHNQLMSSCSIIKQQPGGGLSNTAAVVAALGSQKVQYVGVAANDQTGDDYVSGMEKLGVTSQITQIDSDKGTGTADVVLSNNGQRTFLVSLGVSKDMQHVDSSLPSARIFATEGYLWTEETAEKIETSLKYAHDNGALTAFALCADSLVKTYAEPWRDMVASGVVDIVFADKDQLNEFFGSKERDLTKYPSVTFVETKGRHGAAVHVLEGDEQCSYTILPHLVKNPIDTNGAGDAFMGGFVSGMLASEPGEPILTTLLRSGDVASCAGSRMVQQIGTKPQDGAEFNALVEACTNSPFECGDRVCKSIAVEPAGVSIEL